VSDTLTKLPGVKVAVYFAVVLNLIESMNPENSVVDPDDQKAPILHGVVCPKLFGKLKVELNTPSMNNLPTPDCLVTET
jgi:hypothetical protein